MVVTARPDLIFAVNGWLRTFAAEWSALGLDSAAGWKQPMQRSGLRISSEIQGGDDGWKMPTRAIVLRKAGGPVAGDDYALGIRTARIDTFSYGATGADADGVWALLDAILVPTDGRSAGWAHRGARVANIRPEAEPLAQTDQTTGYRRVWAPYQVTWMAS